MGVGAVPLRSPWAPVVKRMLHSSSSSFAAGHRTCNLCVVNPFSPIPCGDLRIAGV